MACALLEHLGAKFRDRARRLRFDQRALTGPLLFLLREDLAERFAKRFNER